MLPRKVPSLTQVNSALGSLVSYRITDRNHAMAATSGFYQTHMQVRQRARLLKETESWVEQVGSAPVAEWTISCRCFGTRCLGVSIQAHALSHRRLLNPRLKCRWFPGCSNQFQVLPREAPLLQRTHYINSSWLLQIWEVQKIKDAWMILRCGKCTLSCPVCALAIFQGLRPEHRARSRRSFSWWRAMKFQNTWSCHPLPLAGFELRFLDGARFEEAVGGPLSAKCHLRETVWWTQIVSYSFVFVVSLANLTSHLKQWSWAPRRSNRPDWTCCIHCQSCREKSRNSCLVCSEKHGHCGIVLSWLPRAHYVLRS